MSRVRSALVKAPPGAGIDEGGRVVVVDDVIVGTDDVMVPDVATVVVVVFPRDGNFGG